jgi:GTP-binding protein
MSISVPQYAHTLFAQPCDFVLAAAESEQFPLSKMPEIAFIGRSNVGKSSLINALVGRKKLARTAHQPGRTQQIIFFNLGQKLMLVDLPGYGYAKAPRSETARWYELMKTYLKMRPTLNCVCLLIDGRHGVKENDQEMMTFLDRAAASYQIVLTKVDKVSSSQRDVLVADITKILGLHPAARPGVLMTSAAETIGIEDLRMCLAAFVPA